MPFFLKWLDTRESEKKATNLYDRELNRNNQIAVTKYLLNMELGDLIIPEVICTWKP